MGDALKGLVSSGGRVADGREQRVQDDVGFWNRAQALAYRAMLTRLRTGEEILVKVFDAYGPEHTGAAVPPSASLTEAAALRATSLNISTFGQMLTDGRPFILDRPPDAQHHQSASPGGGNAGRVGWLTLSTRAT
ncbi:hypothetical protein [Ancylobacter oerskovii]|uniref:Uncharacterized protein n=1 Tax=Ancylobacter oerskovii TaxID=459519 RepID=A0ABW4Z538_9HYPH|nr:hypothetical protein [Ancylobacter oerskovii]MBS7543029.1 hypothetical protein [Ancylobacter oerskovii]